MMAIFIFKKSLILQENFPRFFYDSFKMNKKSQGLLLGFLSLAKVSELREEA
jgi:hypothetical protein